MATCYVTKRTASCSAIIDVLHGTILGTITLLLHDSVETGFSHLKDMAKKWEEEKGIAIDERNNKEWERGKCVRRRLQEDVLGL